MCTKDKHGLVSDFAWYISILCSLSRLSNSFARGSKHVALIAEELVEITLRVESVRPFAVESMISLLLDEEILASQQRMILAKVCSNLNVYIRALNVPIVRSCPLPHGSLESMQQC